MKRPYILVLLFPVFIRLTRSKIDFIQSPGRLLVGEVGEESGGSRSQAGE